MTRLACTVAGLVVAALAATSFAADRTVVETRDVPDQPLPGSLRAILASAHAGDRIRFAVTKPVEIAGDVAVPAQVTIVGPVVFTQGEATGGALVVDAAAVRLQRINFGGVPLRVKSGADGVNVLGCRFVGPWGGITVLGARNAMIGSVRRPNRFVGFEYVSSDVMGVVLDSDQGTTIVGNSFGGSEGGVLTKFSATLMISGNVFRGARVEGNPETATVTLNRFLSAPVGGNAILLRDYPDRPLPGLVSVVANVVKMGGGSEDGIVVARQKCAVLANRVSGPRAAPASFRAIVAGGIDVHVAGNVVSGAETGVQCTGADDPSTDVVVEANLVSRIRGFGVSATAGAAGVVNVTSNVVRANLPDPSDRTTGVVLVSNGGAVVATKNSSTSSAGYGFQVFATGGTIDITDNLIAGSAGHGVAVHAGDGLVRASANAVLANGGDAYHFDAGSHAEVSVSGATIAGNAGEAVLVEDGAVVVRND
jgi:hypothetical protein